MDKKNTSKSDKKMKKTKSKSNVNDTKNKKKKKIIRNIFMILIIAIFIAVIIASAIFVAHFKVAMDEFNTDDLVIGESNSTILDSEGNVIATLNGDEKRKIISLSDMADYLPKAYIAIEDERFEQHNGVDFKRTGHAVLNYVIRKGSTSFGGSTITQQLVKNATSDKDKTIDRKLKEWARAYKVESVLSKDQILETYLNIIFVGQDYYGVELGAKYYFNKTAKDLTLAECAFMAGINNSPNSYKPFSEDAEGKNMQKIKKRTKTVLAKMKEQNYIKSDEEYNNAVAEVDNGLAFSKGETTGGNVYSYHTDALLLQLVDDVMKEKGISKELATSYIYGGGLTIYSTQNSTIQTIIDNEVKKDKYKLKSKKYDGVYAEGAIVVMDQDNGYVLGCSGGLGEKSESRGLNRATQITRQTGSAGKPISVLAPALVKKIITPSKIYVDEKTTFDDGTEEGYTPTDYNGFQGKMTVRRAVESSQNIPFVKIIEELTPAESIRFMRRLGVTTLTDVDDNLNLALGGLDKGISPLEMAGAYSAIANDGEYIEPTFYSKIEGKDGIVVFKSKQIKRKVFSKQVAYMLKSLLKQPVEGNLGTATYCKIPNIDVAAKTGTTNENNDRWLCGFTNYYTSVVWYGYDKNERISYNGNNPAGVIWSEIMKFVHSGLPASTFEKPKGVVELAVCKDSGELATHSCNSTYTEVFTSDNIPDECLIHGE